MDWLFLVGAGKIAMYMVRSFARSNEIKSKFFVKLFECNFCVGTWIYFCLMCFFRMELTSGIIGYFPLVSEMLSAMIVSFVLGVFSDGWTLRFGTFGAQE